MANAASASLSSNPLRASSSLAVDEDFGELYVPPNKSLGRVPALKPVESGGKPISGDFPLDQVVIDQMPVGCVVHAAYRYGASAWTVTGRVETTLADGTPMLYFVKYADGDVGRAMLEGEYHSMVELYKWAPNFVPQPHAWGKLNVSDPDTYFFYCEFIEMTTDDPDPFMLATKLAQLHLSSRSPTGKFGFSVPTCRGNVVQAVTPWQSSWVDFFIQIFRGIMDMNTKLNGDWKDLGPCVERTIKYVVPQVLGPLEADGRKVTPYLIHGDIWDGNVGTSLETSEVYVFDASVYYAHHELEIALWRGLVCKQLGARVYQTEYLAKMGVSEPAEQFEDRQRLYSAYMTLHASACHKGSSFRVECLRDLKWLLKKYAPSENAEDE